MSPGVTRAIQRPSTHTWRDHCGLENWSSDYASWRLKVHRDPPGATAGKRELAAQDTRLPAPLLPLARAVLLSSIMYWASR